jgi:hypothetical protein
MCRIKNFLLRAYTKFTNSLFNLHIDQTLATAWLTVGTSIFTLWIAVQVFWIDVGEPQLKMLSPNSLRIEFSEIYMNVFAQPIFIVENPTKKIVVISKMCMEIQGSEARISSYKTFKEACRNDNNKSIMTLEWTHVAKFGWDNERDIGIYQERVSDALPLPVSISSPQTPMAGFYGDPENEKRLNSDRCYRATIYALKSSKEDELLQTSFHFKLSKKDLEGLNKYPKSKPLNVESLSQQFSFLGLSRSDNPLYGIHRTLDTLDKGCKSKL